MLEVILEFEVLSEKNTIFYAFILLGVDSQTNDAINAIKQHKCQTNSGIVKCV